MIPIRLPFAYYRPSSFAFSSPGSGGPYKPQFGLTIPIALAAGGYCCTFAAAAVTAVLLTLLTTIVFGVQVWHAFFVGAELTRTVVLEQGDTGWHKI